MNEYQIKDESRSYYFMMPNILDDLDLSVYAFRLYSHYKRVAGENGTCWQSVKTMSEKCKMAMGSVTNARNELQEKGLIKVTEIHNPTGKAFIEVTIIDIWDKNKGGCSLGEVRYSPHENPTSPGEYPPSPHEIKNTTLKNNPLKNTLPAKNAGKIEPILEPCDIDGIPDSWKKEQKKKIINPNEYRLADTISGLIGIKMPICKEKKDYSANRVLWWAPIIEMLRQVDNDVERAERIADNALLTAKSKNYNPSNPKTLMGWFMSELAASNVKRQPKIIGKTPDGEIIYD